MPAPARRGAAVAFGGDLVVRPAEGITIRARSSVGTRGKARVPPRHARAHLWRNLEQGGESRVGGGNPGATLRLRRPGENRPVHRAGVARPSPRAAVAG